MRKAVAIEKLRAGHPLICEHDEDGAPKYVVAGKGVPPVTALKLISGPGLISQKDVLFESLEPQSWRLP